MLTYIILAVILVIGLYVNWKMNDIVVVSYFFVVNILLILMQLDWVVKFVENKGISKGWFHLYIIVLYAINSVPKIVYQLLKVRKLENVCQLSKKNFEMIIQWELNDLKEMLTNKFGIKLGNQMYISYFIYKKNSLERIGYAGETISQFKNWDGKIQKKNFCYSNTGQAFLDNDIIIYKPETIIEKRLFQGMPNDLKIYNKTQIDLRISFPFGFNNEKPISVINLTIPKNKNKNVHLTETDLNEMDGLMIDKSARLSNFIEVHTKY